MYTTCVVKYLLELSRSVRKKMRETLAEIPEKVDRFNITSAHMILERSNG